MTLSINTIMPAGSFLHISLMSILMSILLGIAGFGYISVSHLTTTWLSDITDNLNVEIAAHDSHNRRVFTQDQIQGTYNDIKTLLNGEPIVTNITIHEPESDHNTDIPSPIFMTLGLHKNRAHNAESRLIDNIRDISPHIIIRTEDDWGQDIQSTAILLKTAFSMLALSVFLVTIIVLTGIIRTQLKASKDTLSLVHLMGASAYNIASAFQKAIIRSVLSGSIIAAFLLGFIIAPLSVYLGIAGSLLFYWGILISIPLCFAILSITVTYLTVITHLREMP